MGVRVFMHQLLLAIDYRFLLGGVDSPALFAWYTSEKMGLDGQRKLSKKCRCAQRGFTCMKAQDNMTYHRKYNVRGCMAWDSTEEIIWHPIMEALLCHMRTFCLLVLSVAESCGWIISVGVMWSALYSRLVTLEGIWRMELKWTNSVIVIVLQWWDHRTRNYDNDNRDNTDKS